MYYLFLIYGIGGMSGGHAPVYLLEAKAPVHHLLGDLGRQLGGFTA